VTGSFDIIVLGDYFYDLIFSGLPEFPQLGREIFSKDVTTTGGAMYITAVSLHRLGAKVGWPAYFGNDYYSESVYDFAVQEGLDMSLICRVDRPYRRVTSAIPLQGERAFVTFTDPDAEDLHSHWLSSMLSSEFKHLHLGGLEGIDHLHEMIALAHARGATVSADCQDGPHLLKPCECCDKLAGVDIFMPNAREALLITETDSVRAAVEKLSERVPLVVVKDGANGAWVAHEGEIIQSPSIKTIGDVIDTTGAGDCFNAGFLYGYIVEKVSLQQCAQYGNICGGLSVTAVGGATAAPTHVQLMERLNDI
jgi:sugar/nucleoside kinase (ribokinase family)